MYYKLWYPSEKGKGAGMKSVIKYFIRPLHFYPLVTGPVHSCAISTPWSLEQFIRVPSQLHGEHTVLQPFRRIDLIIHIAISVLPVTQFILSQMKHLRTKCLAQGHTSKQCPQYWEGKHYIYLHGRQRHWQNSSLNTKHLFNIYSLQCRPNVFNNCFVFSGIWRSLFDNFSYRICRLNLPHAETCWTNKNPCRAHIIQI